MLKGFYMEDCKPFNTPMVIGCKLSMDDLSKDTDEKIYRSMIGSLLYVKTSKPDVMKVIGHLSRFQATPNESNVISVKIIF